MASPEFTYLIVGAGMFGASTAYYLKQALPDSTIVLLDRTSAPCESAASYDINKIVRADYDDLFYMRLGLEAMEGWRGDKIYSPHYHETGMLIADDIGWGAGCLENYKVLGIENDAVMLEVGEAQQRFPSLAQANLQGVTKCFLNPNCGYADAAETLESVIKAAVDVGVEIMETNVSKLIIDENDACVGVLGVDNTQILAKHILLCTGAYTPEILADTFPQTREKQVGDRLVAAGAVSCSIALGEDDVNKIGNVPVLINTMSHTHGDIIPPNKHNRAKFNYELSFTNKTLHHLSEQELSIPPPEQSKSIWSQDVPQQLKDEVSQVVKHTYGDLMEGKHETEFRMCWDAVTPTQDFLICPHPKVEGLYIAAGGSFHGWKFFPCIGKYVVKMLQGTLDEEHACRWAWDKQQEGSSCPCYDPTRDLNDLK